MRQIQFRMLRCALIGLMFACATFFVSAVLADDSQPDKSFAELQVDLVQKAKQSRKVTKILNPPSKPEENTLDTGKDRQKAAENRKLVSDFLRRYLFAQTTSLSELSRLPEIRKEIQEDYCQLAGKNKEPAAMEFVNGYTSSVMHAICNGALDASMKNGDLKSVIVVQPSVRDRNNKLRLVQSVDDLRTGDQLFNLAGDAVDPRTISKLVPSQNDFHPAAKLNAMLVLSDLNDTQPKRNKPETAVPRSQTRQDLIAYLEFPEVLSDVLLVGVLTGMQRHAHKLLDSEQKKRVAKVVSKLVKAQSVSGRNPTAAAWIRRQAVDILGQLKVDRTEEFLLKAIEDKSEPVAFRISAVDAVSGLDLSGLQSESINRFAEALAQLAMDACQEEISAAMSPRSSFSPDRLGMRLEAAQRVILGSGEGDKSSLMNVASEKERQSLQKLLEALKTVKEQIRPLTVSSDRKQIDSVLRKSVQDLNQLATSEKEEKPPQTAEKR